MISLLHWASSICLILIISFKYNYYDSGTHRQHARCNICLKTDELKNKLHTTWNLDN